MENFSEIKTNGQSTGNVTALENAPGQARDIMRSGVITVEKNKLIYEAIRIMVSNNISGLPVVDDNGFAGIISEKDVLSLLYDEKFLPHRVEEYMTSDVVSFGEEDSLSAIRDCLTNNFFRRVPILRHGKLVGIISRADIIRSEKDTFKPHDSAEKFAQHKDALQVKDVMACGLFTINRQTSIYEAMEILTTRDITGLPVVDDSLNLEGIVTEKDLLNLLYDHGPDNAIAQDIMTEEVVSLNQNDSLFDACQCLMNNHFRRVPVLKHGKIIGIISRKDIIVYILKNKFSFNKERDEQRKRKL